MTFWEWLDRRWPTERGWVMVGLAALIYGMLKMAEVHPYLWKIKLFEVLLQGAVMSAFIGLVLPFFFAANRSDEQKTDNTKAAFEAITAAAQASPPIVPEQAAQAAQAVATEAQAKADEIAETVDNPDLPSPTFGKDA